jgi:hypothetical protein
MDQPAGMSCTPLMTLQSSSSKPSDGAGERSPRSDDHPVPSAGCSLVVVQRDWTDWRTALAKLTDLEHVHWRQPSGARRPLIHAYVPCTALESGEMVHECDVRSAPHRLLVCVLKSHTAPEIFRELSRLADERKA